MGKYTQGREFDEKGNPVKGIDDTVDVLIKNGGKVKDAFLGSVASGNNFYL